ncbi:MAG: metal ABC transporter substrate-binding protein, partial [Planctomycetota bacterium]
QRGASMAQDQAKGRSVRLSTLQWSALAVVAVLLGVGVAAISQRSADGQSWQSDGEVQVIVSIPPLRSFAEALAPDAEVVVMVPAGVSPHGYEPRPSDMATLARADAVLAIGRGLEGRLLPAVDRAEARSVPTVRVGEQVWSTETDSGSAVGRWDAHVWLDPGAMLIAVDAMVETLRSVPGVGDQARFEADAAALRARVVAIDAAYRDRLAPWAGSTLVVQHGAWSRIAERYGLVITDKVTPVPHAEPTPSDVADILRRMRAEGVDAVVTEPQLNAATAERLAELAGVPVIRLDPLGRGDWFAMMNDNLDRLVAGLASGAERTDPASR